MKADTARDRDLTQRLKCLLRISTPEDPDPDPSNSHSEQKPELPDLSWIPKKWNLPFIGQQHSSFLFNHREVIASGNTVCT